MAGEATRPTRRCAATGVLTQGVVVVLRARKAILALPLTLILAAAAWPQAVGSVLSLASPAGQEAANLQRPLCTAVDGAGHVMIVYPARAADGHVTLFSALGAGGQWSSRQIPMPEEQQYPAQVTPRAMTAGPGAGQFTLLATYYGKVYLWRWSGSGWSAGEIVEADRAGTTYAGLCLDAAGEPLLALGTTRFHVLRKAGGAWTDTALPFVIAQFSTHAAYTDATGVPRLLATRRGVPLVVTLPAGSDPGVATSWQTLPAGADAAWKCPIPETASERQYVLDWPHQLVFGAWQAKGHAYVAWGPVGATSEGSWRTAELPLPEKCTGFQSRLVSNGRGGVGIAWSVQAEGVPQLTFHWLSGEGLGPAIPLLRPGTQTEAAVFRSLVGHSIDFCIDDAGTAHLAIVGTKRGETPADLKRLYVATITGGGTATTGPEVTGHGTTGMEREGDPPDLVVRILEPVADGPPRFSPTAGRPARVEPVVEVTNRGAEYYGDLSLRATVEGAEVRLRLRDESNHTRPLLERDQSKKLYLPALVYPSGPREDAPATLTGDYPLKPDRLEVGTGLGRKRLAVEVDPDNEIEEADEDNNTASVEFVVSDGRNEADRERPAGGQLIRGFNDLSIAMAPRLRSNTRLIRAGYLQRPTQLDVVVGNPRGAGFFRAPEVVVFLDDQEVAREVIAGLDRDPNLVTATLGGTIIYDRTPPKPDLSGAALRFPIDLTAVAEGRHRLRVVVDPDDRFADLDRGNNEAVLDFRVRPPGGTLRARVVDFTTGQPISHAAVWLTDLWGDWTDAQGTVEVPDVPAGDYDAEALSSERLDEEPRFFEGHAPAFSVASGGETEVTIRLEKALTVVGRVTDAATGQPVTEPLTAFVCDESGLFAPGGSDSPGHYVIPSVEPGTHRVIVGAYGYRTRETTAELRRAPGSDQCTLDLTLEDGPRAVLRGTVVGADNRPLGGAVVWLGSGPRSAETAADGTFSLDRVAAGAGDVLWGTAEGCSTESLSVEPPQSGTVVQLPPLTVRRITSHVKSVDFSVTAYAQCESSPGLGPVEPLQVDVEFGKFSGALGLTYHSTAGHDVSTVDNVLIWLEGGTFISGGVSSEVGLERLTGVDLDTLKVGPMATLFTGYGTVFKAIDGVNKLAAYLQGPVDPQQMHGDNELIANYVSQTGAEQKQKPFLDVPTSTKIPVAVTFQGGGATVVRVDEIELADGQGHSRLIRAEWYSPGFVAFHVGEEFELSSLTVKLRVAALNSRLQSGILGMSSRNQITWKPDQGNWIRAEGYQYETTLE